MWVIIENWKFERESNIIQISMQTVVPNNNNLKIISKVGEEGNNLIWRHLTSDKFSLYPCFYSFSLFSFHFSFCKKLLIVKIYETFMDEAELDNEVRRVKFSLSNNNDEVIINIPHFLNSAGMILSSSFSY